MRNEDFFYEGAERGDLLDALNGHAHEGATTVLEGEAGSGVSTLLGMLCMSLVGDFELVRLDGSENLGANAVIDAMLVHFDVERGDLADTLKRTLADSRLIVVVDNAEGVPEAALSTMVSLKQKLGARLAYVFGGLPGTAARLRAGGLSVADILELPALTLAQVVDFAEQGMALDLSPEDAEALRRESGGRPGPLRRLLEQRRDEVVPVVGGARRPIPWRHGIAVAALLLVVLGLWLGSGGDRSDGDKVVDLKLPPPPAKVREEDGTAGQGGLSQPKKELGLVSTPERSRKALAEYNPSASDFEKAEALPDKTGEPDTGGGDQPSSDSAVAPTHTAPQPQPQPKPTPAPAAKPASQATPEPAAKPAPKPAASAPSSGNAKPRLSGLNAQLGYRGGDWLATEPDSDWFLQVMATSREDGARHVLDRIDRKGAYYRAKRGGKWVYVVLAGPYPSRDAALKARASLPDNLRKAGPFPREMAGIRKELH